MKQPKTCTKQCATSDEPEVILRFSVYRDREELNSALKGSIYKCILDDIKNHLRSLYKYTDKEDVKIEELREKINEIERSYEND